MAYKQYPSNFKGYRPPTPRARADIAPPAATQAGAAFPTVGMTLRAYSSASGTNRQSKGNRSARPGAAPSLPMNQTTAQEGRWQRWRRRLHLKRVFLVLLVVVLLWGGFVGGKFLYNAYKLFGSGLFSAFNNTKLKGEDLGRVNILLAGNSADDPGHGGADLTDSIMLISIDTRHNQAFMLSIPRDLWVDIPDGGHGKINEAYVDGQAAHFNEAGYPAGGMGELEQIIEQDFGVGINYYALIDYRALKDAVNAVGGIDIKVQSPDPRGLYDPSIDYATHGPLVKLTNGTHHLNGEQALDLARARGDDPRSYGFPQSDFDRTAHQRQMLLALRDKATSAGVLANPARLTSLFDAIGSNVKTDLSAGDVRRLYDLTKSINATSIKSVSLNDVNGKDLLASYQAPGGESALIPAAGIDDFSAIDAYMKQLTSNDPVVQEAAKVIVLNGTDTYGLASQERDTLTAKNVNVTAIGDAKASQTTTTIIDTSQGKKPATKQLLEQLFGNHFTTVNPYNSIYQGDFIVVLGEDQANQ